MFGLGWLEVGIILLIAIVIFGPKKLPELGGSLGKTLRGFKDELSQAKDGLDPEHEDLNHGDFRDEGHDRRP